MIHINLELIFRQYLILEKSKPLSTIYTGQPKVGYESVPSKFELYFKVLVRWGHFKVGLPNLHLISKVQPTVKAVMVEGKRQGLNLDQTWHSIFMLTYMELFGLSSSVHFQLCTSKNKIYTLEVLESRSMLMIKNEKHCVNLITNHMLNLIGWPLVAPILLVDSLGFLDIFWDSRC